MILPIRRPTTAHNTRHTPNTLLPRRDFLAHNPHLRSRNQPLLPPDPVDGDFDFFAPVFGFDAQRYWRIGWEDQGAEGEGARAYGCEEEGGDKGVDYAATARKGVGRTPRWCGDEEAVCDGGREGALVRRGADEDRDVGEVWEGAAVEEDFVQGEDVFALLVAVREGGFVGETCAVGGEDSDPQAVAHEDAGVAGGA